MLSRSRPSCFQRNAFRPMNSSCTRKSWQHEARSSLASSLKDRLRLLGRQASTEQIEAVRRISPTAVAGNIMSGVIVLVASWGVLPSPQLLAWFGFLIAVCGVVLADRFMKRPADVRLDSLRLTFVAAVIATPWAVMTFWGLGTLPHGAQVIFLCIIAAMASNGAMSRASVPAASAAYVSFMLVPVLAKSFLHGAVPNVLLAVLITGYLIFLFTSVSAWLQLWRERAEANICNEELATNFPGGVALMNAQGHIALVNDAARELLRLKPDPAPGDDLLAALASDAGPALADETARSRQAELIHAARRREAVKVQIEYADGTAVLHVGQPTKNGGYLIVLADMTEEFLEAKRLSQSALTDPLTNIFNRAGFQQHLDAAFAAGAPFTLMAIDLDRFKQANDAYGHPAGDAVLIEVANRILRATRPHDCVARVGGDEFMVILRGNLARARSVASRMAAAIEQPIQVDGVDIVIGASIGIAVAGESGDTPDALVRRTDEELYRAKRNQRQAADAPRNAA